MDEVKQKPIEKILENLDAKFDGYSDIAENFNIDLFDLVESEVKRILENKTLIQLIGEL